MSWTLYARDEYNALTVSSTVIITEDVSDLNPVQIWHVSNLLYSPNTEVMW